MLKPSKKIEYALIALKQISDNKGRLVSVREICTHFDTPFDTTAKVLQVMHSAKIVNAVKGVKGGYFVESDLATFTFYDLVLLLEGENALEYCPKESDSCGRYDKCVISSAMDSISIKVKNTLKGITLKSLIEMSSAVKAG